MLVIIILWVCFYKQIIHCLWKLRSKCSETPCWKDLNVLTLFENIKTYSLILLDTFRKLKALVPAPCYHILQHYLILPD